MRTPAILLLVCLLLVLPVQAQELTIKHEGRVLTKLTLNELKNRFPTQTITIRDRHDGSQQTFLAFAVEPLLKAVYGDEVKPAFDVLFGCEDGYDADVPVSDVLAYGGYLAYAFADGKPFTHKERLSPFYLIWDTNKFPHRASLGSWPYQIVNLDLVAFDKRFPRVLPPADASPSARRGFEAFRHYCLSCHKLNGEGGDRAVDLNLPVSVVDYIRPEYLRRIIDNPASVRSSGIMSGLSPDIPDREQVLNDILEYLNVMAKNKAPRSGAR